MIAIIDYGAGNLFSVQNALDYLGIEHTLAEQPEQMRQAQGMILPGVGAFADGMNMLKQRGFVQAIKEQTRADKPLLGICLGMQMLFEQGLEFGQTQGLGLIPGQVQPIDAGGLKIPHMGWNELTIDRACGLTQDLQDGDYVYFVHSFRAETAEQYISCSTMYHEKIPALVQRDNIYGAQFHPEKSGKVGMSILKNFAKLVNS